MRAVLVIVAAAVVAQTFFGIGALSAQKGKGPPVFHVPLSGKVSVKAKALLKTFSRPVATPPRLMPAEIKGRAWCWHRNYGWVSIEAGTAPAGILLPQTWVVPALVQVYEAPVVAVTGTQIICPHCGQVILLTNP